jgi:hypothetical protein
MDNILLSVQDLKFYFIGNERVARALDGVSYEVSRLWKDRVSPDHLKNYPTTSR